MGVGYKDLVAWQRAMELCVSVYRLTEEFPRQEQFGLISQMRRASVSVASNIAEGYGRSTRGEYLQFLGHARGSNSELQTQLILSERLGFASGDLLETSMKRCEDTSRLLGALMKKLRE